MDSENSGNPDYLLMYLLKDVLKEQQGSGGYALCNATKYQTRWLVCLVATGAM